MRLLLRKSLVVMSLATFACDPGSKYQADTDGKGGNSSVTTVPEINPLYVLPTEPPGEVTMSPPEAGELDVFEQNRALGRGINLGNALDAPTEGSWGPKLQPFMFEVVAKEGFDSIRLPVKWSAHAEAEAPYTIDETFFARVDWAIAHGLTRDLKVVLDIHHYGNDDEEGMFDEPEKHHERFLGLWKQIAEHYKDYPKELYFEILNEPRKALEPFWNEYLGEAVAIIRETNPGRTLIAGGGEWNKYYKLSDVEFPDANIIATFHYYNPYCFTHQNQFWEAMCNTPDGSAPAKAGIASWPVIWPKLDTNPEATEVSVRAQLEKDMKAAADWSRTNNRPLYLGEFGVSNLPTIEARADWTASVVTLAAEYGISWAYWQFTSDMGIWDAKNVAFNATMLEALKAEPDDDGSGGASGGSGGASGGSGGASGGSGGASGGSGGASGGSGGASGGSVNSNGGTAGQINSNASANTGSSNGGSSNE